MAVLAPETEARAALKAILTQEFAADSIPVHDDNLHESMGDAGSVIGIAPFRSVPSSGDFNTLTTDVVVKFYGRYRLNVDRKQKVDPAIIEERAERFRRALRTYTGTGSDRVWYFNLVDLNYPDDPTGNKSRFEATVRAYGNNPAVLETVA